MMSDELKTGIIKIKVMDDTCVLEKYPSNLTHEQISFFEHLPPYYHQVNLECEMVDNKIVINKATTFTDNVIENMSYQDLNEWFYHNSMEWVSTIINDIKKDTPVIDWNNLTESQQDWIKNQYTNNDNKSFIEKLVGVENVNKKMFRTWKDVEKEFDITDKDLGLIYPYTLPVPNSLSEKMFAMFKIHILITLGYGEVITDKEWEYYEHERFWGYIADEHTGKIILTPIEHTRNFPVFHTEEQAKKFGSYPENMELLKTLLS